MSCTPQEALTLLQNHARLYGAFLKNEKIMELADTWAETVQKCLPESKKCEVECDCNCNDCPKCLVRRVKETSDLDLGYSHKPKDTKPYCSQESCEGCTVHEKPEEPKEDGYIVQLECGIHDIERNLSCLKDADPTVVGGLSYVQNLVDACKRAISVCRKTGGTKQEPKPECEHRNIHRVATSLQIKCSDCPTTWRTHEDAKNGIPEPKEPEKCVIINDNNYEDRRDFYTKIETWNLIADKLNKREAEEKEFRKELFDLIDYLCPERFMVSSYESIRLPNKNDRIKDLRSKFL